MTLTMPHYDRRSDGRTGAHLKNSSADKRLSRAHLWRPQAQSFGVWAKGQRWVRQWVAPGAVMDGQSGATIRFHAMVTFLSHIRFSAAVLTDGNARNLLLAIPKYLF